MRRVGGRTPHDSQRFYGRLASGASTTLFRANAAFATARRLGSFGTTACAAHRRFFGTDGRVVLAVEQSMAESLRGHPELVACVVRLGRA